MQGLGFGVEGLATSASMFQEFLGAHGSSGMLITGILRIMALYCVYLEGHGDLVSRSRLEFSPI